MILGGGGEYEEEIEGGHEESKGEGRIQNSYQVDESSEKEV